MRTQRIGSNFALVALALAAACAPAREAPPPEGTPATQQTPAQTPAAQTQPGTGTTGQTAALACTPSERMPVEGRTSAYDSTMVMVGGAQAKVCYGRPAARGRTMIGGEAVPYGQLWRTGANEPTIIHLPFAAEIAGVRVEPGSYSLYTIPGEQEWTVIVNRSISQWGHESQYTEQVRAQEVGRGTVRSERTDSPVETFTIRSEPGAQDRASLLLEWENTRVRIPVVRRST
ncbi:MAG TPA: DUF2911 domain-containing protein [Longimicrobiaceae bacterium]|nr:DUF2911 domain-containing protein [Longimicrobiaceae bacterium]